MKLTTKKVLSFVMACAMVVTSFTVTDVNAALKKTANVPTAKLTIEASADKQVEKSVVVTGVAISTKSALTCNYAATLATSIATASAVVTSGDAIKVNVTTTKAALSVTDAAIAVLSNNTTIASVLVTVKGISPVVKKTKSISVQKKVVIAPGKTKVIPFTAKKTKAADKIQTVKVSSANKKIVKAKKVAGKKMVELTVPATAKRGANAKVTLKSGKKSAVVKVYVKNAAKKVKAVKKTVVIKKKKTAKVNFKVTAQNVSKATTDKLSAKVAKKKIAKVTAKTAKKGKVVLNVQGLKKGKSKITLTVGKKKAKVTVKVK